MILGQEVKPSLDELAHHGIKGMKWGVRKEEDSSGSRHSLGQARASINSKRISHLEGKAEIMNTRISELHKANAALEGSKNPLKVYERRTNESTIQALTSMREQKLKDAEAVKNGKLTSTQKKVLIGAAAAAIIIAGAAAYQAHDTGQLNSLQLRGEAFLRGEKAPFKTNEHLAGKKTVDELLHDVAKPVNPGYSKMGGKMNCRRSTFAYELRRRGYDVSATTSASGTGQSDSGFINAVTPGGKKFYSSLSVTEAIRTTGKAGGAAKDTRTNPLTKISLDGLKVGRAQSLADFDNGKSVLESSSKKVLEELAKQPNGARGEVLFNFGSFGHSMAYEIVDGTPHIFDSQKGTVYNAAGKMVEEKWDGFHSAEITRLDNVDLDLKFLSRWATNAGGKKK